MHIQTLRTLVNDAEALAWLSWFGFAIGILGLALSFYFYMKGTRSKRPYCLTFTQAIAGSVLLDIPDFQLTYKGERIKRIAVTKLVFWNAGTETIAAADTPTNAPMLISIPGDGEILNFKLDFVRRKSNAIAISLNESRKLIKVEFEYLDKNDGFILELLHTASSDDDVEIQALFKGAHDLVRRSAAPFLSLPAPIRRLLAAEHRSSLGFSLLAAAIVSVANVYFSILPSWFPVTPRPIAVVDWIAFAITYGGFTLGAFYLWRTRLPEGYNLNW